MDPNLDMDQMRALVEALRSPAPLTGADYLAPMKGTPPELVQAVQQAGQAVKRFQDFPLQVRFKKGGGMVTYKQRF